MKKILFALAVIAMSACSDDCPRVTPQDPDDVRGVYEVKYRLWIDDMAIAPVEGLANVGLGPWSHFNTGESVELAVTFSPWNEIIPEGAEMVSWLRSGLVELKGTPGDYSVSGRSGNGDLRLSKEGEYYLTYYGADVSVSGKIVRHAGAATRCSPVPQTPDMYHDIALTIEASVNVALSGAEPRLRTIRLEIFQ